MNDIVDKKTVEHVARLARLGPSDIEVEMYQKDLVKILGHIHEIDKIDTQDVAPLYNNMREFQQFYSTALSSRPDEPVASLDVKDVLKNAPESVLNQFKVEAFMEVE
jgi:aspartyl-tRNA(Asn)/glutamyl-tRNA(Gln) amidotransferase subunit C